MMLVQEIGSETWNALQTNIVVCCVTVVYSKLCLRGIASLRQRSASLIQAGASPHSSKHLVYLMFSTSVLLWPLFDTSDWSWRLNVVLPTSMLFRFLYKGAIHKQQDDSEVQTLSRSSSPSELLCGPVIFSGVFVLLGLFRFMTEEAIVITAALGIGDSIAPVVGARFGRHMYQLPLLGPVKTMEGSVCGVFLGTCSGIYFFLYCLGIPLLPLRMVLVYSAIAAVAEGTSPGHMDNLIVPVVLHFFMDRVQRWLPP